MKRLLLIAYNFPPSTAAGVFRTARFVRWLPRRDWQVFALTIPAAPATAAAALPDSVSVDRTAVVRPLAWLLRLRGDKNAAPATLRPGATAGSRRRAGGAGSIWTRFKDMLSLVITFPDAQVGWALTAIPRGRALVRRNKIDVLYTSGPPHSSHLIGLALHKLTGRPWVADFRDPWARKPWVEEHERRVWRMKGIQRLERLVVRNAERVILNTERLRADFARNYPEIPDSHFVCIPNGYDPAEFAALPQTPRAGPFRITHAGTLYRRRNPVSLLEATRALLDQGTIRGGDIEIEFIGAVLLDGISLEEEARRLGLGDVVTVRPAIPHAECLGKLGEADVLLAVQPDTETQIPGKLYEYLYIGKPVLALSHPGATSEFVRENGLGEVANPDAPAEVRQALARLYLGRGSVTPSRERQRALAHHHIEALTEQLDHVLSGVTPARAPTA